MKAKQKLIALASPAPQMIDEEAEAVRDQTLSDAYSASEPLDDSDQAQRRDQTEIQAWEDVGLKHAGEMGEQHADPNQGGAISPHLLQAPVAAADDDVSGDEEMEFPSSSHKHPANVSLHGDRAKFQKMDDDPVVAPKSKAARKDGDVHQVAEVEVCPNHEPEVMVDDWEDSLQFSDSEDECISNQAEGEGPPQVSSEKLRELDEQAALDELEKMRSMEVIQPVVLTLEEAAQENTVDTTLVFDWRFRGNSWIRRCCVVAREFRTTNTDEDSFSPTSAFSAVRMLLTFAVVYGLAVTSLDIKDAFLMVAQVEVMYVEIPQWVRERTGRPETHWLLQRCWPGQRNAALRWHQHFAKICEAAGLRSFPGSLTVLRHMKT